LNSILNLDSRAYRIFALSFISNLTCQSALAAREQNLILVYSKVNAYLQQLPAPSISITQQLASA